MNLKENDETCGRSKAKWFSQKAGGVNYLSIVKVNSEFFNNDAQTNFDSNTHANPGLNISETAVCANNI